MLTNCEFISSLRRANGNIESLVNYLHDDKFVKKQKEVFPLRYLLVDVRENVLKNFDPSSLSHLASMTDWAMEEILKIKNTVLHVSASPETDQSDTLRVLRLAGQRVEAISIDGNQRVTFDHIRTYCSTDFLNSIHLHNVNLEFEGINQIIRDFLPHLKSLSVVDCQNEKNFVEDMRADQLVELTIRAFGTQNVINWRRFNFETPYPALQSASLSNIWGVDIGKFLQVNNRIKKFHCDNRESMIYGFVATHVPTIEFLDLESIFSERNSSQLGRLTKLKSLHLRSKHEDPMPSWSSANQSLRQITLTGFNFRAFDDEMRKFELLEKIEFNNVDHLKQEHIEDILLSCSNLHDFSISTGSEEVAYRLTGDNLTEVMEKGKVLQKFKYTVSKTEVQAEEYINFDKKLLEKMKNIMRVRSTELNIFLNSGTSLKLYHVSMNEKKVENLRIIIE